MFKFLLYEIKMFVPESMRSSDNKCPDQVLLISDIFCHLAACYLREIKYLLREDEQI